MGLSVDNHGGQCAQSIQQAKHGGQKMLQVNMQDPASVHDSDLWIKCCGEHSETHICATEDVAFGGKRLVVGASLHRIHAQVPLLYFLILNTSTEVSLAPAQVSSGCRPDCNTAAHRGERSE